MCQGLQAFFLFQYGHCCCVLAKIENSSNNVGCLPGKVLKNRVGENHLVISCEVP